MSVLSLTGMVYGAGVLYRMPRLSVIAMQTATFITAVSLGVLILLPERVPMRWLRHGGTVEARSPGVGLGSEFVVRLPVVADQRAPARLAAGTATGSAAQASLTS